nr:tensin [Hymenolepis microstoma]
MNNYAYLGSIPFEADNLSRAAFVRSKLDALQPVTLCISTAGVKVCDLDCKTVYMAHALRRISYATCDPFTSKFAFLAREANSETPCQYCHIFSTDTQFQAEELNAIIGDAFKLAFAKQRMQQSSNKSISSFNRHELLPPLSSLHSVELQLPQTQVLDSSTLGGKDGPPLRIPPPPSTSPPPPPSPPNQDLIPLQKKDGDTGGQNKEEISCNGKSLHVSSGLQRHWLDESGQSGSKLNAISADSTQSLDAPNGAESAGPRQRALSDPRAPGLSLFFQQTPSTPQTPAQQRDQPPSTPSVRHSVAFFDTPATPRLSMPPSTPLLSATPVSIKDKNRAIFDLPLSDHPLTSSAASPVVALKTHLDSLANPSGHKISSSSHHKKSSTAFPLASSSSSALTSNGPSTVVSRFRLRHSGGSSSAGAKKRQLERPLSQIICQLDSALLLNNSPSFSIQQPRSEERLSAVVNNNNSQSTVAEEVETGQQQLGSGAYDEDDVIEGIPRAVVQCLDDLENPPIPPTRVHSLRRGAGEIFGHFANSSSSETASPHGSRGRHAPLQSLSESSGFEILDLEHSGGSGSNGRGEATDDDDPEALEFAILEAAAEAEEQAAAASVSGERKRCQLGDVCPVPPLADHMGAWQPSPSESDIQSGSCPLHAGLESSPSPLHNGNGQHGNNHHHQQQQLRATTTTNGDDTKSHWWPSGINDSRSQQAPQPPPQSQIDQWTGETPTPTATPTPTPTPANLLPNAHQHLHSYTPQSPSPPWFQAYLPREVALELLTHEETGSFLVRDSVTQPGCWALSVRVPTHVNCVGITHYLIQRSKHGVKLKGLDKEWPSLEALITHLTVIPEMLPCPLRLPPTAQYGGSQQPHQASNPTFTEKEENNLGEEPEDEEYQRLSDFSSMLADMQVATNNTVSTPTAVAPRLFR